jgi:hypothetical protein
MRTISTLEATSGHQPRPAKVSRLMTFFPCRNFPIKKAVKKNKGSRAHGPGEQKNDR